MQHPIGEHALLADSRTAALIDPDGTVAWLCWPRIDSTPLLFSILDSERGGGLTLRPKRPEGRVVNRRYHPRSLVLETVWEVDGARLIVDDALDVGPEAVLVRRLRAVGGDVEVEVGFRVPRWGESQAGLRIDGDALEVVADAGVIVHAPAAWAPASTGAVTNIRVEAGEAAMVTLASPGNHHGAADIDTTLAAWHRMVPATASLDIDLGGSRVGESLVRDLLGTTAAVLVGLHSRSGGIVAAPTTSLPQWPASARTWDYRYCWLRDASLAGIAMLQLGLIDAARRLGAFVGNVVSEHGPVPLVRVDGSAPPDERERHDLVGYRGARPIRIGNAAAAQAQLDVPGEVIEFAASLAALGALPDELAAAVPVLAGWLAAHWREPDNGIWEIRGRPRRYTHSLVTAMSGLAAAADLVGSGQVTGDADAWQGAALSIHTVLDGSGALELRLDGGGADAALAQLALLPGLDAIRPRAGATLDLIVDHLGRGGLVDRYEGQPDTLDDPCAPFVFPTFWLSAALTATGRDGSPWLDAALATRGPLGLFGEVADPQDRSPLGNYPQVQGHAAFARAVTRVRARP
jgi:GH15 family glucan-1,4-alpha-glucosidase